MIVVIDYEVGDIKSICNTFHHTTPETLKHPMISRVKLHKKLHKWVIQLQKMVWQYFSNCCRIES